MLRYSEELIDEIRNSNDIVDVISQYVVLKRSGRNFFGLCPFHKEKSPSFSVSPDKQIFHCFGCGVGGNVFHFISKIEGVDFRESVEILADKVGIALPTLDSSEDNKRLELKTKVYEINQIAAMFYHENVYKPTSKIAQEYIKKRKLDNKTLKNFMIGYSGNFDELYKLLNKKGYKEEEILASSLVNKTQKGGFIDRFRKRLMFPICDIRGRVIAFGGRVLDDSKPKYINSPENIVYSKGRHLYGLNLAKNADTKTIIIVEGYMDVIALSQRGVKNVVASLGTALTEYQGRLLRKTAEKVIISYDSDVAGQAAALRGLEILQDLGSDIRILQMESAKDPDEYVTKFGSARFEKLVDNAISLVEFKVKLLKRNLDIHNVSDKIKFLNEIAKIIAKVENDMEKEVYIDKISKEYHISKEAIYAQVNKLLYPNSSGSKKLENKNRVVKKIDTKEDHKEIAPAVLRRENMLLSLLISKPEQIYHLIKDEITKEDFKSEINKEIINRLYEEFKTGDINKSDVVSLFQDEKTISHLTEIMAEDYDIQDIEKFIEDILNTYKKEKYINERNGILKRLENSDITKEERTNLEKDLSMIIIELAKMK